MFKYLYFVVLGLILSACSTKTVNLDSQLKNSFENKTITFTNRAKPIQPDVMTPTKAIGMSGMVGFLDSLVLSLFDDGKTYEVKKVPSLYINNKLVKEFVDRYHMKYVENDIMTDKNSVDDLVNQYKNSDYILDNDTTYWMVSYYPTHWGTYSVGLFDVMRLIDTKNSKVIAQKMCKYYPEYKEGMPSYDEMFADNGKLIKIGTKQALDYCVEDFKKLLFK